jgi:uncharacterized protein YdaU (DUF1376 family)
MKKTYFNHDSNSRNDIRIIKLRSKLSYEGYGIFWALLELLFTEENKLCLDDIETLAFGLQCESSILKQVINDFDLFVIEDNCFYSKRLNKHIEQINNKSLKAQENANKRWSKQSQSVRIASKSKSISKEDKSKSIEKRIIAFKNAIHSIKNISNDDKNDFFAYWTEKNKSGSKFRAELERTFDVNLRLKRWANNGFNKNKNNKFPDNFDSLYYKKLDNDTRKQYEEHLKKLGWTNTYSPNAGMVWHKPKNN